MSLTFHHILIKVFVCYLFNCYNELIIYPNHLLNVNWHRHLLHFQTIWRWICWISHSNGQRTGEFTLVQLCNCEVIMWQVTTKGTLCPVLEFSNFSWGAKLAYIYFGETNNTRRGISALPSKNAVSAYQMKYKLLPFTLEEICRNEQTINSLS